VLNGFVRKAQRSSAVKVYSFRDRGVGGGWLETDDSSLSGAGSDELLCSPSHRLTTTFCATVSYCFVWRKIPFLGTFRRSI